MVVKIHHGSLSSRSVNFASDKRHEGDTNLASGSKYRLSSKILPCRLLKYWKLAYISKIQYGWTASSEKMKKSPPHRGRKGLILSHAMTLCSVYDIYSGVAVVLSTQPKVGSSKKMKMVCPMARMSYLRQINCLP